MPLRKQAVLRRESESSKRAHAPLDALLLHSRRLPGLPQCSDGNRSTLRVSSDAGSSGEDSRSGMVGPSVPVVNDPNPGTA